MTQKLTRNNILHKTYKELSIQISLSGLSFCIYNTIGNTVEELQSVTFATRNNSPESLLEEVKKIINSTEILKQNFDTLKVIYLNNLSAFVPDAVFNEELLAEYLKYNIKILPNDFITYDKIEGKELVNVYIPFVNINNFFLDWFGEFEYEHIATVLVNKLLNISKASEGSKVFIHLTNTNEFQLIVINQKKLILYNSFNYNTPEDFIYYVLFVFEQLELDTENIPAILIANTKDDHPLYKILYTYIRFVDIYSEQALFNKYINLTKEEVLENFALINMQ
ncbi:hypothetical protein NBRC110019_08960 [Neptunitalea chrysea]|uniref:DUF3822 family protein n=1 Tax=Neptunitalea chrysea TaxID=1647581 RepID=A0A9W6B4T2_9FLAO|nr:DUF3822 family protein [Neptunitalea chrysea]GLB51857.1 hypothetical protein NBRC110019_08960 [Neptunitalea chrysea]